MFTTSSTSLRRIFGAGCVLVLSSACLCADVAAQTPSVVSSSAVAVPNTGPYGAPWQASVTNHGDFVLFDFKTTGMYEFPANGGAQVTVAAPGAIAGGFSDSGIAIDPRNNNIYLDNNYNGGLIEYPYDAATGTWDLPQKTVASGLSGNLGGTCGNYFQSAGLSMNASGVLAVATENGCGVEIFTVPVDASGNFGTATPIVSAMSQRAKTVAIDNAGNISFNEDAGGIIGAYFIPAGTTGLVKDTSLTRIDPSLTSVQGVTVDAAGNVYVVDGSAGAYLVPLESGAPNPAHAVLLTSATASGGPSLDTAHNVLFYPTGGYQGITNVVKIALDHLELGTSPVGTAGATPGNVTYTFNAATTPFSFLIEQDGATASFALGDLSGCGITTTTDDKGVVTVHPTAYPAKGTCAIPITFTPTYVGDASATLQMLDSNGNVLASTILHGVGQGSSVVVTPGTETKIGSALQSPSQVAVDSSGTVYVADSGLGKVLQYAKGAGSTSTPVSLGTGLTAPTGVAVDPSGNLYIADSGSVFEVPYGPKGLTAAGQLTLKTGLGTNLKLATDAIGNLFIADPDNQRVITLRTLVGRQAETDLGGFSQLSAIAADAAGDLFVASGQDLIKVPSYGAQSTVLTSLSGANGLAVDASGAVYITETGGTVRIPNEAGTLTAGDETLVASTVNTPNSVAVDTVGNVYIVDGTAKNVDYVNANGFLNLGTLPSTTSTQNGTVTILNDGNLPLNITGFAPTADFSETTNTCIGGPIAVGASCTATITFNPGPGDQGALSGLVLLQGDAADAPIGINATGVGASLAASKASIAASNLTVTNAPIVVNVASVAGTGPVPSGNATLTVTGNGITPITFTQPIVNGTVTFSAAEITAGTYTFTVKYAGDRVYGTSTVSTTATIGSGAIALIQPAASAVPTYVLAGGTGSAEPYDNSQVPYYYNYPVVVKAADAKPLIGVPIYGPGGKLIGTDYGTVTYVLAGGAAVCPGTPVNADGTAPLATNCFNINNSNNQIPNIETTYTVTPVYTGNSAQDYATSTGSPVTFIALRNPSVTLSANPASLSVTAGAPINATMTVTSLLGYGVAGANGTLNNYSLPLELECANLPAHSSCSFTYPTPDPSDANSVDVNVNAPGTVIMTLNTNVPVGTTASLKTEITLAAMFGFSLVGLAFGKKRKLRDALLRAACLLLFSGAVAGLSSCSTKNIGIAPVLSTPKGTYTITVTAKQTGSKTVPNPITGGAPLPVVGNGNQISLPFTMSVTVQ